MPLVVASTVVTAAGQIYAGTAKANQMRYEAQVADQNARLASQQASEAQDRGVREAQRYQRQLAQIKGRQQAAMAANGLDTSFGSALQVQQDTAMIGAEDTRTIYDNTANEVKGYEIDAANYRSGAAAKRTGASQALVATAFDVAGTALGGASQVSKFRKAP